MKDHRRARGEQRIREAGIDPDLIRVPVGPGALHVDRYGRGGMAIALLHGFGTDSFLWRAVGPALAEARHTALALNLLGFGESDRPVDAELGIAAQTEYVDRALSALRVPRAVVVGVDLGGAIALRLAATRSDRVSHLVLVNSLTADSTPAADVRALQRNTARYVLRVATGILGAKVLLTPLLEGSVANAAAMPDRLVARYLAPYVGKAGVAHLLALARAVTGTDLKEVDPRLIRVPTLVIRGEADRWLADSVAESLATSIAGAGIVRLPGVGRLVPEEAPDRLTELILALIARAREAP